MNVTRAGIFAAGAGSRLGSDTAGNPIKPMALVQGKPLCHWVVSSLAHAGVKSIVYLSNSRGQEAQTSLICAFPEIDWTFLTQDTASSWESFRLVASRLASELGAFALSTVDALVPPAEVRRFLTQSNLSRAKASLALTDFIDDEKPLWADIDSHGYIKALGDKAQVRRYATAGIYHMTSDFAARLPAPEKYSSLREFWMNTLDDGTTLSGVALTKTLDVDRPEDLSQAQDFVRSFDEDEQEAAQESVAP